MEIYIARYTKSFCTLKLDSLNSKFAQNLGYELFQREAVFAFEMQKHIANCMRKLFVGFLNKPSYRCQFILSRKLCYGHVPTYTLLKRFSALYLSSIERNGKVNTMYVGIQSTWLMRFLIKTAVCAFMVFVLK